MGWRKGTDLMNQSLEGATVEVKFLVLSQVADGCVQQSGWTARQSCSPAKCISKQKDGENLRRRFREVRIMQREDI
jgi:hypothetical protein